MSLPMNTTIIENDIHTAGIHTAGTNGSINSR